MEENLLFHFSFTLHWSHNDYFEIETDCKRLKTELPVIHTIVKSTKLGCKHVTNKIALALSPLERVLGLLTFYEAVLTLCLRN